MDPCRTRDARPDRRSGSPSAVCDRRVEHAGSGSDPCRSGGPAPAPGACSPIPVGIVAGDVSAARMREETGVFLFPPSAGGGFSRHARSRRLAPRRRQCHRCRQRHPLAPRRCRHLFLRFRRAGGGDRAGRLRSRRDRPWSGAMERAPRRRERRQVWRTGVRAGPVPHRCHRRRRGTGVGAGDQSPR